jgi:hypothetical protein
MKLTFMFRNDDHDHDDDVDGVRLRLWTATNNSPLFIPQVVYNMENYGGMLSTENSWFDHQSCLEILPAESSGTKQEEQEKGMMNFALRRSWATWPRPVSHIQKSLQWFYLLGVVLPTFQTLKCLCTRRLVLWPETCHVIISVPSNRNQIKPLIYD